MVSYNMMENYKTKICARCGQEFKSASNHQFYCKNCKKQSQKERDKQYKKQYYLEHKEHIKQHHKKWLLEHKEYNRQYYLTHSEYERQYYLAHFEHIKQYSKQRCLEKKEQIKQYRQSSSGKEAFKRFKAKRQRNLGFIPLNEYFKDADAHHLDKNYVIYIPQEEHKSIWHSVLKNINMDEINALAFNYLKNVE